MMGKQRSGTALWQRLVSDFSLRTTTAFGSFWEARQPGEWIKRNIVWRVLEGGWVGGWRGGGGWGVIVEERIEEEKRRGKRDAAMDHRFSLSSGKVHWNSCSDSCHLFSCSLVPGVHLSAFTVCSTWQKGRGLIKSPAARNRFSANLHISNEIHNINYGSLPSMDKAAFSLASIGIRWFGACEGKTTRNLADSNSGLITNSASVSE